MFGVIVRRSLIRQRVAFTDLLFFLILSCKGQELIGPSQPIVALVGDDVILPCHLEPTMDVFTATVEWARSDLNPRFVLVWRDGLELKSKKHPSFEGRTTLFIDELKHGNVSLKISDVTLSDRGTYRCFIPPPLTKSVNVELVVDHFTEKPTVPSTTHDPPGSQPVVIGAVVAVVVALVLIAGVVFAVMGKRRQNKPKTRRNHKDRTEEEKKPERDLSESNVGGGEERKALMEKKEKEEEKNSEPRADEEQQLNTEEREREKRAGHKEEKDLRTDRETLRQEGQRKDTETEQENEKRRRDEAGRKAAERGGVTPGEKTEEDKYFRIEQVDRKIKAGRGYVLEESCKSPETKEEETES